MDFADFSTVPLISRDADGFVYVLCFIKGGEEVPFYVGQTQSIWGRLNDYFWADFQACTDFRVGETIKHLNALGVAVIARYKRSADRLREERAIIERLRAEEKPLLNHCGSYDYRSASPEQERARGQQFVDEFLCIHKQQTPPGEPGLPDRSRSGK